MVIFSACVRHRTRHQSRYVPTIASSELHRPRLVCIECVCVCVVRYPCSAGKKWSPLIPRLLQYWLVVSGARCTPFAIELVFTWRQR
ncbi:hypothetical protein HBH64_023690 [Parastagonospora nodorum]|nr:hypothetical protein HBI02_149670 [Parastagonospora nodorum]KAH4307204.1 hypothetical protein HBI01_055220 [Parastagonospora nodorum]KAH4337199.1 hypothetical protein HBI00_018860 [Parastagonospora nodorum]KAH4382932.1 hypothetical protein HBH94_063390 [Parastagonospora nodorum]KAH4471758.1 hypothetical protein HBH90_055990 [Parastagonospora nodorum]